MGEKSPKREAKMIRFESVIAVFLCTALIGCSAEVVERPKEQEVSRTKQEDDRRPSSTPTFTYRPGSGLMIEGR
jgi:hypothetical protein